MNSFFEAIATIDDQTAVATTIGVVFIVTAILATGHALLYKRDPRAALLWIGLILLSPVLGSIVYYVFGINRIKRAARQLRETEKQDTSTDIHIATSARLSPNVERFIRYGDRILDTTLTSGNSLTLLRNGDEAYPAMLAAIDQAETSISLCTYIFDNDSIGRKFVKALGAAQKRGVKVRVLIDGVGANYSFPTIFWALQRASVPAARFLPPWRILRLALINMRSHRKLLCIDGKKAFCGGMNIRAGHVVASNPRHPVTDIHFEIAGPLVPHLQHVFAADWRFATKETLEGDDWFPQLQPTGPTSARAIPDGPDEHFEKIRWLIIGSLSLAQTRVRILTPYFIPDASLVTALNTAALRGVEIDIVLPAKNNLPWMQWAAMAILWQVVEKGCRVYLSPPPFDHSKLMIVDRTRMQFGSANWDARSLRLNFELDIECFDPTLAAQMDDYIGCIIQRSKLLTLADLDSRSMPTRLKHGAARLLAPVL